MAKTTGIAWARSTFNPWIGCTEVSPGCDACYARELDARHKWGGATHWGPGVPRHRTAASSWAHPLQWNRIAGLEQQTGKVVVQSEWNGKPGFYPVFPSLCDPFDNEVPLAWRADFWRLIRATPNLTWLLLTKRIGNVEKMHPGGEYPNVWIGASVVNQEEAGRDIPKLLQVRSFAKRFISYEPALGPIDFWKIKCVGADSPFNKYALDQLDQIIVGGESDQGKHKARPFNIEWARSTVRQCKAAGVAVFVKQLGSHPQYEIPGRDPHDMWLGDRAGADPAKWPEDLRVQEFPT
jgi:protein gp37